MKTMKTQFDHFNFPLKYSWNYEIKKVCDFWNCPRKIEIKVNPFHQLNWIEFWDSELNQGPTNPSIKAS
jgi:hypothetical protein